MVSEVLCTWARLLECNFSGVANIHGSSTRPWRLWRAAACSSLEFLCNLGCILAKSSVASAVFHYIRMPEHRGQWQLGGFGEYFSWDKNGAAGLLHHFATRTSCYTELLENLGSWTPGTFLTWEFGLFLVGTLEKHVLFSWAGIQWGESCQAEKCPFILWNSIWL